MIVNELDVVRLKDGREGTIVMVHTVPRLGYEIEFEEEIEEVTETIEHDQIEAVLTK